MARKKSDVTPCEKAGKTGSTVWTRHAEGRRKGKKTQEKPQEAISNPCSGNEVAIDASFLIREPAEEYHAKAKDFLSSHRLAEFRRNPPLFRKRELGLIEEDEDRPAYLIGRAAHTLILEGPDAYTDTYAFGGPVNDKTGEHYGPRTKAYQEWAEAQGKPVLSDDQAALIEEMNKAVRYHRAAFDLLSSGVPEGVVRAEYCGVPCQVRLDWLNPKMGIVDLKSTDDLGFFEADARRYGYPSQAAFYRSVLAVRVGGLIPVYLIACEKREPFRVGVWRFSDEVLAIAARENEAAIRKLQRCRETDTWESGYEMVRCFDWI